MRSAFDAELDASGVGGARAAAWALHGLHASDRAWALTQLDDAQRRVVVPLLAELTELADLDTTPVVERPVPVVPDDVATVMHARPAAMAEVLAAEPVKLIRQVMALADWPWAARTQELLAAQGLDIGGECPWDGPAPIMPEALRRVLLAGLATRLGAQPDAENRGWRGRWRARLAWRRR